MKQFFWGSWLQIGLSHVLVHVHAFVPARACDVEINKRNMDKMSDIFALIRMWLQYEADLNWDKRL